ncbi:MAG: hypothetical protein HQL56_18835, partial [Magnetococcales bacterium]|nr:hypothetical protein [Magnetococcales bacterium]
MRTTGSAKRLQAGVMVFLCGCLLAGPLLAAGGGRIPSITEVLEEEALRREAMRLQSQFEADQHLREVEITPPTPLPPSREVAPVAPKAAEAAPSPAPATVVAPEAGVVVAPPPEPPIAAGQLEEEAARLRVAALTRALAQVDHSRTPDEEDARRATLEILLKQARTRLEALQAKNRVDPPANRENRLPDLEKEVGEIAQSLAKRQTELDQEGAAKEAKGEPKEEMKRSLLEVEERLRLTLVGLERAKIERELARREAELQEPGVSPRRLGRWELWSREVLEQASGVLSEVRAMENLLRRQRERLRPGDGVSDEATGAERIRLLEQMVRSHRQRAEELERKIAQLRTRPEEKENRAEVLEARLLDGLIGLHDQQVKDLERLTRKVGESRQRWALPASPEPLSVRRPLPEPPGSGLWKKSAQGLQEEFAWRVAVWQASGAWVRWQGLLAGGVILGLTFWGWWSWPVLQRRLSEAPSGRKETAGRLWWLTGGGLALAVAGWYLPGKTSWHALDFLGPVWLAVLTLEGGRLVGIALDWSLATRREWLLRLAPAVTGSGLLTGLWLVVSASGASREELDAVQRLWHVALLLWLPLLMKLPSLVASGLAQREARGEVGRARLLKVILFLLPAAPVTTALLALTGRVALAELGVRVWGGLLVTLAVFALAEEWLLAREPRLSEMPGPTPGWRGEERRLALVRLMRWLLVFLAVGLWWGLIRGAEAGGGGARGRERSVGPALADSTRLVGLG